MLSDRIRTSAFRKAIEAVVRPGQVVLDLGSGSGIMAFFAAKAGARKVYAIEQTNLVDFAQNACTSNGLSEKVSFIKGHSSDISLPEKVDVVISETIGSIGFDENIIRNFIDARGRFLKTGGSIIPARMRVFCAPVSVPCVHARIGFWKRKVWGFDFPLGHEYAANTIYPARIRQSQMFARPRCFFTVDLGTAQDDCLESGFSFSIERPGIVHGFAGWFSATLSKGVDITNAPGARITHWSQNILPLPKPVVVRKGDRIHLTLQTIPLEKSLFWNWKGAVRREWAEKKERVLEFDLSTFRGYPQQLAVVRQSSI